MPKGKLALSAEERTKQVDEAARRIRSAGGEVTLQTVAARLDLGTKSVAKYMAAAGWTMPGHRGGWVKR